MKLMKSPEVSVPIYALAGFVGLCIVAGVTIAIMMRRVRLQQEEENRKPAKQYSQFKIGRNQASESSYSELVPGQSPPADQSSVICSQEALNNSIPEEEAEQGQSLKRGQGIVYSQDSRGATVEVSNVSQFGEMPIAYDSGAPSGGLFGMGSARNRARAMSTEDRVFMGSSAPSAYEEISETSLSRSVPFDPRPQLPVPQPDSAIMAQPNTYDEVELDHSLRAGGGSAIVPPATGYRPQEAPHYPSKRKVARDNSAVNLDVLIGALDTDNAYASVA